jgi:hypothetical protein
MNFHKRLHALSHYKPVYKLVSAGKRIVLPGFDGLPLFEVVSFFIKRLEEGEIQTRARSLAFSFLLALFPGIIFIFTVIPYIPIDSFQDRLLELIRNFLPASTFELAHETIEDIVRHQHGGLLSFGFVFALYVTTDGIIALMNWFNKSFHGKRERAGWKQRLIALGITHFNNRREMGDSACVVLYSHFSTVLFWPFQTGTHSVYFRGIITGHHAVCNHYARFQLFHYPLWTIQ